MIVLLKSIDKLQMRLLLLNMCLSDLNLSDGWEIFHWNHFAHHFHDLCKTEAKY